MREAHGDRDYSKHGEPGGEDRAQGKEKTVLYNSSDNLA